MSQMVPILILKLKYDFKKGGDAMADLTPTAKNELNKSVDSVDVKFQNILKIKIRNTGI